MAGWEVTGLIGAGSWGTVHAARRTDGAAGGPAEAALKFLTTAGLAPRQARELAETARREAEFSRQTDHPHLVRVLDVLLVDDPAEPTADGSVVLVMERASHSLQDVLAGAGAGAGAVAAPDPGAVLADVCAALVHLHEAGWVHGDLKPANILVHHDGSARLADFGLITRVEGTHGYAPPWGSPDYLPPERRSAELDERGVLTRPSADVWALGVTAHQLLTGGELPFPGGSPGARAAAAAEYAAGRAPLRLAPQLPSRWRELITDCLTADPVARGAHTARSLLPRLAAAAADGPAAEAPTANPRASRRRPRSGRSTAVLAAAASLLACTASVAAPAPASPPAGSESPSRLTYGGPRRCEDGSREPSDCPVYFVIDPYGQQVSANFLNLAAYPGQRFTTDCAVHDGHPVTDAAGGTSRWWYQVQLGDAPGGHAYLSALYVTAPDGVRECDRATPWSDTDRRADPDYR